MPPGENGEEGKIADQRENNLQMNEIRSISQAGRSDDFFFLSI